MPTRPDRADNDPYTEHAHLLERGPSSITGTEPRRVEGEWVRATRADGTVVVFQRGEILPDWAPQENPVDEVEDPKPIRGKAKAPRPTSPTD